MFATTNFAELSRIPADWLLADSGGANNPMRKVTTRDLGIRSLDDGDRQHLPWIASRWRFLKASAEWMWMIKMGQQWKPDQHIILLPDLQCIIKPTITDSKYLNY
jgi:hypothetical protein